MKQTGMSNWVDVTKSDEKKSQKDRREEKVDLNPAVAKKSRTLPASVTQPSQNTQSSSSSRTQYVPTEYGKSLNAKNNSATSNTNRFQGYANPQRSTSQYSSSFSGSKAPYGEDNEIPGEDDNGEEDAPDPSTVLYSLSKSQKKVIDMIMQRKSVFFTGAAGTGKSYILRILREIMEALGLEHKIVFTAPTGVAACNIRGLTIHSWSGIGKASESMEALIGMVMRNSNAAKRWKEIEMLVIDEVSMLSSDLFDKLDIIGRRVRNNLQPFGGIQVILCGDFFQLPPVGIGKMTGQNFCFTSNAWQEIFASYYNQQQQQKMAAKKMVSKNSMIVLQKVFRQQEDRLFLTILQELRLGIISSQAQTILQKKVAESIAIEQQEQALALQQSQQLSKEQREQQVRPTKLFSVNEDVDRYNSLEMERLASLDDPHDQSELKAYLAKDSGKEPYLTQLKNGMKAPYQLILRKGAQVMLLKNLSTEMGLVNGARGTVIGFEKNYVYSGSATGATSAAGAAAAMYPYLPIVKFSLIRGPERREEIVVIKEDTWDIKVADRVMASRIQIPLILAWAISIHKSQGMTIPLLEVSCQRMFEYGQAYVALSRATCLQGLTLKSFQPHVVKAHPAVKTFYEKLVQWEKDEEDADAEEGHHSQLQLRQGQLSQMNRQRNKQEEDSVIDVSLKEFMSGYRIELDQPNEPNEEDSWMDVRRQEKKAATAAADKGGWKNTKRPSSDLEEEFLRTDIVQPHQQQQSKRPVNNNHNLNNNNPYNNHHSNPYSLSSSSSSSSSAGQINSQTTINSNNSHVISLIEDDGHVNHSSKQQVPWQQNRNGYSASTAFTQQLPQQQQQQYNQQQQQHSQQQYSQHVSPGSSQVTVQQTTTVATTQIYGQNPHQANHSQVEKMPLSAELKRKIEENRQTALKKMELFKKQKEQEERKATSSSSVPQHLPSPTKSQGSYGDESEEWNEDM